MGARVSRDSGGDVGSPSNPNPTPREEAESLTWLAWLELELNVSEKTRRRRGGGTGGGSDDPSLVPGEKQARAEGRVAVFPLPFPTGESSPAETTRRHRSCFSSKDESCWAEQSHFRLAAAHLARRGVTNLQRVVGSDTYCSPRHMMPFSSRHEGSKRGNACR
jgi:hypothetical protein